MTVLAVASLATGCALARVQQPEADTLATWSEHPLPPDAAMSAKAVSEQSSCTVEDKDRPIRVLIQDRRTQQSAAFLFAGRAVFGSCFVTTGGGGTSGGSGPLPANLTIPLVIDENGGGDIGSGTARILGGRVANGAAQVIVELADGRSVFASVGNGYWLAWWPDTSRANRVVAKDANGAEISTVGVVG
jgi:hypothetical protein